MRPVFTSARRPAVVCAVALCIACGEDPTAGDPVCAEQPTITVGESRVGALQQGDRRYQGAFIDYYALQVSATDRLTIRLSSSQIDPVIYVFNSQGEVTAQAFEPVGSPPGEIEAPSLTQAFNPGCHLLGASSYGDETGEYSLTAEEAGP